MYYTSSYQFQYSFIYSLYCIYTAESVYIQTVLVNATGCPYESVFGCDRDDNNINPLTPGSSGPGQRHCVVFLGKTLNTLTVPLSTQVYKRVPANLMLGVALQWTSIPSRRSRNTHSRFMLWKPGIGYGVLGHWLIRRLYLTLP